MAHTYCLSVVFTSDASTSASTSARTNAINQVKTKFDANTSKIKIKETFCQFEKLFRREVIWIQRFHWRPRITTCGYALVIALSLASLVKTRFYIT